MTEERKKLIAKFQQWLDSSPRKQIIAAVCAHIAEDYHEMKIKENGNKENKKDGKKEKFNYFANEFNYDDDEPSTKPSTK